MKQFIVLTFAFWLLTTLLQAQIGIHNEDPRITLDAYPHPTLTRTEGIIAPRLTRNELNLRDAAYTGNENGAIVLVTALDGAATGKTSDINQATYYYYNSTADRWVKIDPIEPWNSVANPNTPGRLNTENIYQMGNIAIGRTAIGTVNGAAASVSTATDMWVQGATVGVGRGGSATNAVLGNGALATNTTGQENTAVGQVTLNQNTTGRQNTAIGSQSLASNIGGIENTAVGSAALIRNTAGSQNVAVGRRALETNESGSQNTTVGMFSSRSNTIGNHNVAVGMEALHSNQTGSENTAIGTQSLFSNTASSNTGLGARSLRANTSGAENTAVGLLSMTTNTTGTQNTAIGAGALQSGNGSRNTALGYTAMRNNAGSDNVAVGFQALQSGNGNQNIAMGRDALVSGTSGSQNTAIGHGALANITSGSDHVGIGHLGGTDQQIQMRSVYIGNSAGGLTNQAVGVGSQARVFSENSVCMGRIAHINATSDGGISIGYIAGIDVRSASSIFFAARVDGREANGRDAIFPANRPNTIHFGNLGDNVSLFLGNATTANLTSASDKKLKKNIKENVPGINFIKQLQPVTYNYDYNAVSLANTGIKSLSNPEEKQKMDSEVRTGLIAQDVEKVAQSLNYDFDGIEKPTKGYDAYRLNYESFVVPLIKTIQEQQVILKQLEREIAQLEKELR